MFKVNSCGTTSLTGLSNLSMTGPTGMNGPVGIKSRVQNYITKPMKPYTNIRVEPVPVNVESNPESTLSTFAIKNELHNTLLTQPRGFRFIPQERGFRFIPQERGVGNPQERGVGNPLERGVGNPRERGVGNPLERGVGNPLERGVGNPLERGNQRERINLTPFKGKFTQDIIKTQPEPHILTAKPITKSTTPLASKPVIRENIHVGQNQPTEGLLTYTLGPSGLQRYDGSDYIEIRLPFQVEFDYVLYNKIYLYSRSYITFGEKYELPSQPGAKFNAEISGYNPPIQSILVGASIGVASNFYYGLENGSSTFRIRYEGYRNLINNIPHVWEVVFYRNNPSQIDISAETMDFQGLTGLSSGSGLLTTFNLTTNSGITCIPTSVNYTDILLRTPNLDTSSGGNDTINVDISPLYPIIIYSEPLETFGFTLKNDIMEDDESNLLEITSPYDISLLSTVFIGLYTYLWDISVWPTYETTHGPGGYVSITRPNLQPTTNTSNIEIENGYCKLLV